MKKLDLIITALFLFLVSLSPRAQHFSRFNTFSYNVNEGLLQSTILDLAFDQNNCWWLSYPNGMQRFDGKNFVFVPVQPGLPDNKYSRFFKSRNGSLLISHQHGISRYDLSGNKFSLIYRNKEVTTHSPAFIGEYEGVIYILNEEAEIIGIRADNFKQYSLIKTGWPGYKRDFNLEPRLGDNIIDGKAVMIVNKKIYSWDLKNGRVLYQSAPFPDISPYLLRQINDHEILFYTYTPRGTLKVLNTQNNQVRLIPLSGQEQTQIGRAVIYQWKNRLLLSVNNRIFETDTSFLQLKSEIVNFQNQPPAENATVHHFLEDNFGNLFVRTITGGIRKIIANNFPLNYYSNGEPNKNFVLSIFPDKTNNRILAGVADNGLMIFDSSRQWMQQLILQNGAGKPPGVNAIIKNGTGDYYIFCYRTKGVWKLSADLKKISLLPLISSLPSIKSGLNYFCKVLYQDHEKALVLSETEIYRLDFATDKVFEFPAVNGYIMSGLYCKPRIILHCNDELLLLDENNFNIVRRVPFPNTGGIRCYLNATEGKFYAGTNKGIFLTDTSGKIWQHFNKESGLPDECIYAMAYDQEKNIWCSSNKGIFKIVNGKVTQHLMKKDGLQENEFNTNAVATATDGELYFGGVNGFNSFFPSSIDASTDSVRLLITGLLVNNEKAIPDTADWMINELRLPYDRNALSFDFAAMGNHNPDQYIYQYRMDGVDKQWIQNDNMQTVRYSLAPGKYTFHVYASRSFDKNAKPMKSIRIIIRAPFWKTWWFLTGISVLFFGLISFGLDQRNKRKYAKRLQQLENERQIKLERERISKDLHDSLGAYANAVLYNIELLEKEKAEPKRYELMGDLKFASKDIITSLRETVWAFKKEQYMADECLLRIRNFVQSLSRYYQSIHFIMEGEAPEDRLLHYTRALNIVRVVQEAVTNSIKHAGANTIRIRSVAGPDNKWELTITDDGRGFDMQALKESEKGNGLHNMEQRSADADMQYSIASAPGKGTTIKLMI